jgi:hypothetical protein
LLALGDGLLAVAGRAFVHILQDALKIGLEQRQHSNRLATLEDSSQITLSGTSLFQIDNDRGTAFRGRR